jgi:AcrR family transcriptional regulator
MNQLRERRQEEKARRRTDILDAAEAVAADVGVDAMTMDLVAQRARLSRALIYVYFEDKFDLTVALCERGLLLLLRQFRQAASRHHTGLAQVAALGRAYVNFAQQHPLYFQVISLFQAHAPDSTSQRPNELACKTTGDDVHAVTIAALRLGIADGSIRHDLGSPKLVAITLWGFMHGTIQLAMTKAEVLASDAISVRQLVDSAIRQCTRSLQSPADAPRSRRVPVPRSPAPRKGQPR